MTDLTERKVSPDGERFPHLFELLEEVSEEVRSELNDDLSPAAVEALYEQEIEKDDLLEMVVGKLDDMEELFIAFGATEENAKSTTLLVAIAVTRLFRRAMKEGHSLGSLMKFMQSLNQGEA